MVAGSDRRRDDASLVCAKKRELAPPRNTVRELVLAPERSERTGAGTSSLTIKLLIYIIHDDEKS